MTELAVQTLSGLPLRLGMTIEYVTVAGSEHPDVAGGLVVAAEHLNPAETVHAATIVALADTACGYGCLASLPDDSTGFTTIELKANYLGTAIVGDRIRVLAQAKHRGSTTQVWDADVTVESSAKPGRTRTIAMFRCTQMILRKR